MRAFFLICKVLQRIHQMASSVRPPLNHRWQKNKNSGLTLIEVLVGAALMLVVFLGIFGLIQLGMKVVAQSKARITATALANQKIELAHNLAYNQVGTVGGIPNGSIPEDETDTLNGVAYSVKTTVVYVDDPFDGTFPNDPLPWDYKRVKVTVSWTGFLGGSVFLITDIVPNGVETTGSGGVISLVVFDANGQPVPQAAVHVENPNVSPAISADYQTNDQGELFLPGAPACNNCYNISATKSGYSLDRTYAVGEVVGGTAIAVPDKPFLSVLEGQQSDISFSIDRLSTQTVQTKQYVEEVTWDDSFSDQTQIDAAFQTIASTTLGDVMLDGTGGQYFQTGYLVSKAITPSNLDTWGRFNWNQDLPPSTLIKYHLLYATSSSWQMIPDSDLTIGGVTNSSGFTSAPIDLSGLDPQKYQSLKLEADFSTTDFSQTPLLHDWQITWFSSDTNTPVANLAFLLRGTKTVGTDSTGNPVYKYQQNLTTDSNGQITLNNLEWDSYQITINNQATGYDLANSEPAQPVALDPNTNQTVVLKLAVHQSNTLLVAVQNAGGLPLTGATVHLYKTGYDKLKVASDSGQAFFSPLSATTYTLEVKMTGYEDWSNPVTISSQTEQNVSLSTL